jgi:hypothetical protein
MSALYSVGIRSDGSNVVLSPLKAEHSRGARLFDVTKKSGRNPKPAVIVKLDNCVLGIRTVGM